MDVCTGSIEFCFARSGSTKATPPAMHLAAWKAVATHDFALSGLEPDQLMDAQEKVKLLQQQPVIFKRRNVAPLLF